jgi:hypothetical protein
MPNTINVHLALAPDIAEAYARWLQGRADHTVQLHWGEPCYARIEDVASRREAILRRFPALLAADRTAAQIRSHLATPEASA